MIPNNPIAELLAALLSPDWRIEGLAEQLLAVIAQRSRGAEEFVLDADTITDRQSRRILRPLLACLATKSAAEAGASANLHGGQLSFKRPDPEGRPVWILGQFENKPGAVRRRPSTICIAAREIGGDDVTYHWCCVRRFSDAFRKVGRTKGKHQFLDQKKIRPPFFPIYGDFIVSYGVQTFP